MRTTVRRQIARRLKSAALVSQNALNHRKSLTSQTLDWRTGDDFAVMGMHFKLGLYEHQSAGALQAVIDTVVNHPNFVAR